MCMYTSMHVYYVHEYVHAYIHYMGMCVSRGVLGEHVCACMNVGMYIFIAHPALGKEMCSRGKARLHVYHDRP